MYETLLVGLQQALIEVLGVTPLRCAISLVPRMISGTSVQIAYREQTGAFHFIALVDVESIFWVRPMEVRTHESTAKKNGVS